MSDCKPLGFFQQFPCYLQHLDQENKLKILHCHGLNGDKVCILSNYVQHSPSWEANSSSTSQEMFRILWNTKVHCYTNNSPPPVPILSQVNPVQDPQPISWRFILILSSHLRLGLPSRVSLRFLHQNRVRTSPIPMPHPSFFSFLIW
jgi:hypothetical protein